LSSDGYILAIDLGTSGPKVAITTREGRVLGCETHPTRLELLDGGGAEQDPEDWWAAIVAATAKLHARGLAPAEAIEAIGVTSQWAGTVAVDADGKPLHRAIIWMDSRGAKYVRRLVGGPLRFEGYGIGKLAKWLRRTGGVPSLVGKEPLSHILWLRNERPEVYRRAHKFLEPKDYLNLRLCGETYATYDSIALHWSTDNRDITRIDYDDELLALASLPRNKLPDLTGATSVIGTLLPGAAEALGLSTKVKVVGGTPDVQSAAIGSGAVRDFQAHVYLGTSSWLTCHVPFKKTDLFNNMASLPSAIPGRYFIANEQETAGKCLEWLRDNVIYHRDALSPDGPPPDAIAKIVALAEDSPAGAHGVVFTPWLYGERCPEANHTVRSGFHNQSLRTTRPDLVRAVLEGVAYNSRWLLQAVDKFTGRTLDPIRVIGGGARSALWCQIYADVLGRTIEQVADPVQCNARGAALVAALGLGFTTVDEIPKLVTVARRYEPIAAHRGVYDERFATFRAIYRATKGIYAGLHRH
jgi:xylulokinase